MYELYDYQKKIIRQTKKHFKNGVKSIMIVSPPGSGKSVVISEIARTTTEKKNRVLFLVHRTELADQIKEDFEKNQVDMNFVDIYTVATAKNRLDKIEKPSLIITDEAHHSIAKTYVDIYNYFKDSFKLGFTATPWRLSGDGFTALYETMVLGPEIKWLIENDFLAKYDYYAPKLIDEQALKSGSSGDFSKESMDSAMTSKAYGDVVKYYRKYSNNQQAILYAHSIEESEELAKTFIKDGINAVHVDSKTPSSERKKIMQDFKNGDLKVLCNVDLISEGFNVPDCRTVIMMRPTQSLVLYMQQSMRSMRYKPGKKAVILDHVGNSDRFDIPSVPRDWKIFFEGKKKKSRNGGGGNNVSIQDCPNCHFIMTKGRAKCPDCGYVFQTEKPNQGLDIDENAELEKIDIEQQQLRAEYLLSLKPEQLETSQDIDDYCKLKGYKKGWAYYKKVENGIISPKK